MPYLGPKWGSVANGTGATVTVSFAYWNGAILDFHVMMDQPEEQALFILALSMWEGTSNIDFVLVPDSYASDIRVAWELIDGDGGVLAHTQNRASGFTYTASEITFDYLDNWTFDPDAPSDVFATNFFSIAVHEIGHAVGLGHDNDPTSIMYPFDLGTLVPTTKDLFALALLYGFADNTGVTRTGTSGDDDVAGSELYDTLSGGAGVDFFFAYGGNDLIDGGAGIDYSFYDGPRAGFHVFERGNNPTVIVDLRSYTPEGIDALIDVERLVFRDGVLALDIDGNAGSAYRLYQAAFDRTPDSGGLAFWIGKVDQGMGLIEMAARFIDSNEFRSLYGLNPTPTQFVDLVYANVLDRKPDAGGYSYWNGQMAAGMSEAEVLARFSDSTENKVNVLGAIADGIWLPDTA